MPSKKPCLEKFVEPLPPLPFKPRKQIVMILNGQNTTNKSTNSGKFKQRIDLASFINNEYEKSLLEQSSNTNSTGFSVTSSDINNSKSSNESGARPKKVFTMTIGNHRVDPKRDVLKNFMTTHADMMNS